MADIAPWFPCRPKSPIRVGPRPDAILLIATLTVICGADSRTEDKLFRHHKMRSLRAEPRKGNGATPMGALWGVLQTG